MAINYDSLPSTKPSNVIPAGFYKAKIINASMKISKTSGDAYLSVQYDLTNDAGVTGKLFDMLFDSEKEFLRYKLQRFLTALNLNLSGSFELKDLCKLVNGKELIVDVNIEDSAQYGKRNSVNSFENEIYYPINNWAALTGANETSTPAINASDALDNIIDDEEY